jgi:hypothetical protein
MGGRLMVIALISVVTVLIILGMLSKGAGNKDTEAEVVEQVAYLIGNRMSTLGFAILAIHLYARGHFIIATIPTLIAIKGIMYDSFNSGRLRELIQYEDI